jgi:hypothetical protein
LSRKARPSDGTGKTSRLVHLLETSMLTIDIAKPARFGLFRVM